MLHSGGDAHQSRRLNLEAGFLEISVGMRDEQRTRVSDRLEAALEAAEPPL